MTCYRRRRRGSSITNVEHSTVGVVDNQPQYYETNSYSAIHIEAPLLESKALWWQRCPASDAHVKGSTPLADHDDVPLPSTLLLTMALIVWLIVALTTLYGSAAQAWFDLVLIWFPLGLIWF
jgi:hypothetical protein